MKVTDIMKYEKVMRVHIQIYTSTRYIYIYIYISVYVRLTSQKVVACKYHSTITMVVPDPMLTR